MLKYLKKNWLSFLGLFVGVAGVFLSYYFYSISVKSREPVFVILSNVAIFSSPTELPSKYIRLIKRSDGKELSRNLYVQEVVLWNNGREAIKKSHLLKPLSIIFEDKMEIIDAFISEMRRPDIVNGSIKFKPGGKQISLDFNILEKDDGIKIQIVYVAMESHEPKLVGTIEGVPEIKGMRNLSNENILLGIAKFILYAIAIIGALAIVLSIPDFFSWVNKKAFRKHHRTISTFFDKIFQVTFILFILSGLIFFVYTNIKEFSEESAIEAIPKMNKIRHEK